MNLREKAAALVMADHAVQTEDVQQILANGRRNVQLLNRMGLNQIAKALGEPTSMVSDRAQPDDDEDAMGVRIGVVAVPSTAAQSVADDLIAAGIGSLLNFAPVVLTVPNGVSVRNVDLGVELQILGYHEQMRSAGSSPRTDAVRV